jgi:hypothetical protein
MPSKNVVNDDGKEESEDVGDDLALAKYDASALAAAITDSAMTALAEVDSDFSSSSSRRRPKPRYS